GLGLSQSGDAAARRVAVGVGLGRHFRKLVDDMFWRGPVGIAHAKIDDVLTAGASRGLHRIDLGEYVRRQPADAVKFFGHADAMREKAAPPQWADLAGPH